MGNKLTGPSKSYLHECLAIEAWTQGDDASALTYAAFAASDSDATLSIGEAFQRGAAQLVAHESNMTPSNELKYGQGVQDGKQIMRNRVLEALEGDGQPVKAAVLVERVMDAMRAAVGMRSLRDVRLERKS